MTRYSYEDESPAPGSYMSWYQQQPKKEPSNLIASLLPLMITLPALTTSTTNIDAIKAELAAVPVPAVAAGAQPTKAEFDAVRDYAVKLASITDRGLGNGSVALKAQRQSLFLSLLVPMLSGDGASDSNQTVLVLVMFMMLNGGLSF